MWQCGLVVLRPGGRVVRVTLRPYGRMALWQCGRVALWLYGPMVL